MKLNICKKENLLYSIEENCKITKDAINMIKQENYQFKQGNGTVNGILDTIELRRSYERMTSSETENYTAAPNTRLKKQKRKMSFHKLKYIRK